MHLLADLFICLGLIIGVFWKRRETKPIIWHQFWLLTRRISVFCLHIYSLWLCSTWKKCPVSAAHWAAKFEQVKHVLFVIQSFFRVYLVFFLSSRRASNSKASVYHDRHAESRSGTWKKKQSHYCISEHCACFALGVAIPRQMSPCHRIFPLSYIYIVRDGTALVTLSGITAVTMEDRGVHQQKQQGHFQQQTYRFTSRYLMFTRISVELCWLFCASLPVRISLMVARR
jgi:hypothetical protein